VRVFDLIISFNSGLWVKTFVGVADFLIVASAVILSLSIESSSNIDESDYFVVEIFFITL
jgi:hypothetical protein